MSKLVNRCGLNGNWLEVCPDGLKFNVMSKRLVLLILCFFLISILHGCKTNSSSRMKLDFLIQETRLLNDSIQFQQKRNSDTYALISAIDSELFPEKVAEIKEKTSLVKSMADEVDNFSRNLMCAVVKYTEKDGSAISDNNEIDYSKLKRINSTTIPNEYLIGKYESGKARIFRFLLLEYKEYLSDALGLNLLRKQKIEELLDSREYIPINNQKSALWEEYYFGDKTEGEVILTILRFQLQVRKVESSLAAFLYSDLMQTKIVGLPRWILGTSNAPKDRN